ncbi:MAG: HAMP domain-containing sensor histidine kinase [Bacteroidaceae bacterium]
MRTLLSKTRIKFITCMTIVFMFSVPLFYLITKNFYAEDMMHIIESVEQGKGIPAIDLEQDIIAGIMIQFLLVFFVISLSFYITIRFIARHLWHPFDDTLRKTELFNIMQGKIPNFIETDIYEFKRLNNSLIKLMEKDSKTFRIQKEFSENASHELQTPLALMRSKLDLLIQEKMNEKQMLLVDDLYKLTMRMSHLNRNLLLLAKIDNEQYADQEEVDIMVLLSNLLLMYNVFHEHNIQVKNKQTFSTNTLRANPFLLECLLKNLVINAIRYSPSDGRIQILVQNHQLLISNFSIDNKPLDANKVFHRFSSDTIQKKGNGLGLAIVKSICDLHRWTVQYKFKDGKHNFIVIF